MDTSQVRPDSWATARRGRHMVQEYPMVISLSNKYTVLGMVGGVGFWGKGSSSSWIIGTTADYCIVRKVKV